MKTKLLIVTFSVIIFPLLQVYSQTLQWRELPSVPITGRYDDLYFINPDTGWMITSSRVLKTTNSGETWTINNILGGHRSIGFFDSETGILGALGTQPILRRTVNGGANWTPVTGFPEPGPLGVCGISIADENTSYIVGNYYQNARAYKTTDKGLTWNLVFNDTSLARTLVDCYFWSSDSGLIAGGYNTSNYSEGNSVILLTVDGGSTWQSVYKSIRTREWCWKICFNRSYSESFGVVSVERHPEDGISYILKTTNKGYNWTEIPFMAYDQEGVGFVNENTGWVGGWGVNGNFSNYMTTNGGLNWSIADWGSIMNRVRFINDTLAFACGRSGYKYSRTLVGIPYIQTEIPEKFTLYQNYPNPFNPLTVIEFDIPRDEKNHLKKARLVVYDITGKEIRELINQNLSPGSYQINFDGGYFPSGVYFYELSVGEFKSAKRMILLK